MSVSWLGCLFRRTESLLRRRRCDKVFNFLAKKEAEIFSFCNFMACAFDSKNKFKNILWQPNLIYKQIIRREISKLSNWNYSDQMTWVRVTLRWLLCTVPNFIRSCVLNHMNIQSWFFVRFSLHNFIVSFSLFPLTFMTKKLFPSLAFEPRLTPMHLKNDPLDRSAIRPRHKDPILCVRIDAS